MNLSQDVGEPIVKAFESCLKPVKDRPGYYTTYYCPAGVLTIGWGTTKEYGNKLTAGVVWSKSQCDAAFTKDIAIFAKHVEKQLQGARVTQSQFDALVSWSYNCGGPSSSAVWTYARKGDVEQTCIRLERWNKGGGKVLAGLIRRRKAECELYRGQIDAALRTAGARRGTPVVVQPEPAGRATDRPLAPPSEVARRTAKEAGGVAAGGATTATGATNTGTQQPSVPDKTGFGWADAAIFAGVIIVVVSAVLFLRKVGKINLDWA